MNMQSRSLRQGAAQLLVLPLSLEKCKGDPYKLELALTVGPFVGREDALLWAHTFYSVALGQATPGLQGQTKDDQHVRLVYHSSLHQPHKDSEDPAVKIYLGNHQVCDYGAGADIPPTAAPSEVAIKLHYHVDQAYRRRFGDLR